MKRVFIAFTLVAVILSGALFAQENEGPATVVIKNSTGYDITQLFFSPNTWDDWGEEFLQGESLVNGEEITLTLEAYEEGACVFDLQAVDVDGDYYSAYEIDICEDGTFELTMDHYDGGGDSGYDSSSYDEAYQDGYDEGYRQGIRDAFRDAYKEGFQEGFSQGQALKEDQESWLR